MRSLPKLSAPLVIVGALAVSLLAGEAHAQKRNPLAGQPAIRNKIEYRKYRLDIEPQFMVSINQDYRHAFGPGLVLRFHITDWLSVGIHGAYTFAANTQLENDVRSQLPTSGYMVPNTTLDQHDQRVLNVQAVASGFLSITPFFGKFSLFGSGVAAYDFFVDLGGGLVYFTQNGCCSGVTQPNPSALPPGTNPDPNLQDSSQFAGARAAGMFAVGVHIYFNNWFGMSLELRDYFAKSNPGGLDTNGDRVLNGDDESLNNNIFFGFGLNFLIPPHAKVSR